MKYVLMKCKQCRMETLHRKRERIKRGKGKNKTRYRCVKCNLNT